jgi:hypothetical protein
MAATAMKTTATHSMAGLFQYPKLASCEEKPPVPIAAMAWPSASNLFMPAASKAMAQSTVSTR